MSAYEHCVTLGLAFVLTPEHKCITGRLATQLQREIDHLADAYGGAIFQPHITLIGGVTGSEQQVIATAKKLAASIKVCMLLVLSGVCSLMSICKAAMLVSSCNDNV